MRKKISLAGVMLWATTVMAANPIPMGLDESVRNASTELRVYGIVETTLREDARRIGEAKHVYREQMQNLAQAYAAAEREIGEDEELIKPNFLSIGMLQISGMEKQLMSSIVFTEEDTPWGNQSYLHINLDNDFRPLDVKTLKDFLLDNRIISSP